MWELDFFSKIFHLIKQFFSEKNQILRFFNVSYKKVLTFRDSITSFFWVISKKGMIKWPPERQPASVELKYESDDKKPFESFNFAWNLRCSLTVRAPTKTSFCCTYALFRIISYHFWNLHHFHKNFNFGFFYNLGLIFEISSETDIPLREILPDTLSPAMLRRVITFIRVLFPAPEAPIIAISSPGRTDPDTLSRITLI